MPILFPAESPDRAEGIATFEAEGRQNLVRRLTQMDLRKMLSYLNPEPYTGLPKPTDDLITLMRLKDALERGDLDTVEQGLEAIDAREPLNLEPSPYDCVIQSIETAMAAFTGVTVDEYRRQRESEVPDRVDLHRRLSYEITQAINGNGVQLVLWWHEDWFVPAIYCPSLSMAYFLHTFFKAPAGEKGWRICASCGRPFEQRRIDQENCGHSCTSAAGMRRLRRKLKDEAAKQATTKKRKSAARKKGTPYSQKSAVKGK